jgi:hypothetical protein
VTHNGRYYRFNDVTLTPKPLQKLHVLSSEWVFPNTKQSSTKER